MIYRNTRTGLTFNSNNVITCPHIEIVKPAEPAKKPAPGGRRKKSQNDDTPHDGGEQK